MGFMYLCKCKNYTQTQPGKNDNNTILMNMNNHKLCLESTKKN